MTDKKNLSVIKSENLPKIIAMDVDGTLVPHGGVIGEGTKTILKKLKDKGIIIILVTARPARWLEPVVSNLGFNPIAICGNGALTINTETGEIIDIVSIDSNTAMHVVDEIIKSVPDLVFAGETEESLIAINGYIDLPEGFKQSEGLVPENRYDTIKYVDKIDEVFQHDVYKVVLETFKMSADEFLELVDNISNGRVNVTRSVKGRSYVEFGPNNLSKSKTLEQIVHNYNFTNNDVIAFGDMLNDIDMLEWSGYGVAMKNAHPEVKSIADEVTESASEDGIARVLERIYANEI